MKILISGGHLTPALAVIAAGKRKHRSIQFAFIGRQFAQEKERMLSREEDEISKRKIPFYQIVAAKFHRTYFWRNFEEFTRMIPSIRQVLAILRLEKPDVFLSFGGYLAIPIALVCKFKKILVVTHEQTKSAGLANIWIAKIAKVVLLAYPESKKYFLTSNTIVTGNPVRASFLEKQSKRPTKFKDLPKAKSLIYVTGGSQGSYVINNSLSVILSELTQEVCIVHQCGAAANSFYLKELLAQREALPVSQRKRYVVQEWYKEEEVAWLFQHADLVVSRSGANTVHEIEISKVPALFIPLPFAHNNEQLKNAEALQQKGAAEILLQKDLTPNELLARIRYCLLNITRLRENAKKHVQELPKESAEHILQICKQVYEGI